LIRLFNTNTPAIKHLNIVQHMQPTDDQSSPFFVGPLDEPSHERVCLMCRVFFCMSLNPGVDGLFQIVIEILTGVRSPGVLQRRMLPRAGSWLRRRGRKSRA